MIRIAIVDDHPIVRQGLRFLLEQHTEIEVVGEGEDGEQAIKLIEEQLPDVLLLDLLMPKMDGITAVREITRIAPSVRVIILTSYFEDDQIFRAIKAGALSYLLKDIGPQALVAAVEAAARGESVVHPQVAARILRDVQRPNRVSLDTLTPRELDVITRIAHGRSNHEIAVELVIGEQTVKTHVSNVLSKLHLADRTQAAIYALKQRLVSLDDALPEDSTP